MNILFIGDIVGKLGRDVVNYMIERITSKRPVDFIIANGEKLKNKFKLIIGCLNLMWILCLMLS